MRHLFVLTAVILAVLASGRTSTANAHTNRAAVETAKVRFYHASGIVKWIGSNARHTQYHPNPRKKAHWQAAVRFYKNVAHDAWLVMHPKPVVPTDPEQIVRYVFGAYADQALRVSRDCEARGAWASGDPTQARNGQYLGPFQMGSSERAKYGDGRTMLEMTQAAYRYFVASGKDWSPWECKP